MNNLYGIILAGGSGSRLWPMSREQYPKQLLKLHSDNTLFQSTFLRLAETIKDSNILTITNVKHSTDIKMQLSELQDVFNQDEKYKVLTEPLGRNTAPAIALSIAYTLKKMVNGEEDPILIVAPSDHLVKDTKAFNNAIEQGYELANNGYIVTFGIKPDKPDTGYGYISTSENIAKSALKVKEFKEKPDLVTATEYVEAGTYFWNAGIFMFKASTMLNEFQVHCSEIFDNFKDIVLQDNGPTVRFSDYEKLPNISIDYAVMEKSSNIALIPLDCGWNDMGSWEAIFDVADKDENNNYTVGDVIDVGSKNSLIYGTSKLVSTIGLDNIVVVETEDAVLVCDKDKTQDVKKVFEKLKSDNNLACISHKTVYRPWGYSTILQKGDGFQTKTITLNPGGKLNLQLHNHRSEHWVVLSGRAKVILNEDIRHLNPGESIDIPVKTKHALANPGVDDLTILEVKKGDYIGEDDIVRFEDASKQV